LHNAIHTHNRIYVKRTHENGSDNHSLLAGASLAHAASQQKTARPGTRQKKSILFPPAKEKHRGSIGAAARLLQSPLSIPKFFLVV